MHQCLKFIYFGITLYMFRAVFLSIISSKLYIQQQIYLFWNHTLHVWDGLSVHYHFKTVHTTTNLFILESHSTCFGRSCRPLSGVQNCTYNNKFIYFGITLYMFRTVFPSIIRSSKLYIQQLIYLFWNHTLHVSDGLSVHHQEFKTVRTATNLFIFESHSTCFGRPFRPSSGVQNCTYNNRHLSNRYCCLLASKQTAVQF